MVAAAALVYTAFFLPLFRYLAIVTARFGALLATVSLVAMATFLFWPQEPALVREPVDGRLPLLATPDHYQLRLSLFPEQPSFRGEVEIGLQLHAATRTLYLHGRDLTVHKVEARRAGEDSINGRYQQISPQGLARIDFDDTLSSGFLTLTLQYDGQYTTTSEGLSRVQVDDAWYVFSQLHPIEARRVFPSFDEPNFKATFELEVISWQNDIAIGNSLPSETRQLPNHLKITRLNRTPRLPTYLLNISVGPFDVVNGPVIPANEVRQRPLTLRAVTTRGNGVKTRFAFRHTAAMLTAYEQYFAIPFPFEKLDLIAVPDSSANVLENPGAINLSDELMLIDEQAPLAQRQAFIAHHAHALAHQWFGDLVTMPWWDDLWLSEGFAEWLGYQVASKSHPEYQLTVAMQQQLEQAMQRDGLSPEVRIRQPISREQDVQGTFNTVVYDKAMGLMRMYERFLGADQFRQGLRNYFARHAFGNAGADDLFRSLGDAVADPVVTRSFDSFLTQPGLPAIRLQQNCNNGRLQLQLQQHEYRPAGSSARQLHWQLPVCLRAQDESRQSCRLFTEPSMTWQTDWSCEQLLVPNVDGAGYYRWQLSEEHRQRLLAKLDTLPVTEAMDVAANLGAAVRAGDLSLEAFWLSLPALAQHPQPAVLDSALNHWRYLLQHILQEPVRASWQQQLHELLARPTLQDPNNHERLWFRALTLADQSVQKALLQPQQAALQQIRDGGNVSANVDPLALTIALQREPALFAPLRKQLQTETDSHVRAIITQALALQNNPTLLPALQLLLQSPHLRVNERWTLLRDSTLQPAFAGPQWQWLRENLSVMLPLLPDYRHSQFAELAQGLCDETDWHATEQFLLAHREQLAWPAPAIATTASNVRQCLALRAQLNPSAATAGGETVPE